jgi:hypothetical protein
MRCSEMVEIYDDMEEYVRYWPDLLIMCENREHKERG